MENEEYTVFTFEIRIKAKSHYITLPKYLSGNVVISLRALTIFHKNAFLRQEINQI